MIAQMHIFSNADLSLSSEPTVIVWESPSGLNTRAFIKHMETMKRMGLVIGLLHEERLSGALKACFDFRLERIIPEGMLTPIRVASLDAELLSGDHSQKQLK